MSGHAKEWGFLPNQVGGLAGMPLYPASSASQQSSSRLEQHPHCNFISAICMATCPQLVYGIGVDQQSG